MCCYNSGHSGSVSSPVSGKKLTINNWKGILTNKKIKKRGNSRWIETERGFIENSLEEFSRSFGAAVSENPVEMIEFMLNMEEEISPIYVDSMFSAIAYNANLEGISIDVIEQVFQKFKYDYESYRASYICRIIEKRKDSNWSDETLKMLEDIAINHRNPLLNKPNVTNNDDKEMKTVEMLESNAINSVRGAATETIGALLWEHEQLFDRFKEVIENLTCDNNPAVQYASLYALFPSFNIDKEWASGKIVELYKKIIEWQAFIQVKICFSIYIRNIERIFY